MVHQSSEKTGTAVEVFSQDRKQEVVIHLLQEIGQFIHHFDLN